MDFSKLLENGLKVIEFFDGIQRVASNFSESFDEDDIDLNHQNHTTDIASEIDLITEFSTLICELPEMPLENADMILDKLNEIDRVIDKIKRVSENNNFGNDDFDSTVDVVFKLEEKRDDALSILDKKLDKKLEESLSNMENAADSDNDEEWEKCHVVVQQYMETQFQLSKYRAACVSKFLNQ